MFSFAVGTSMPSDALRLIRSPDAKSNKATRKTPGIEIRRGRLFRHILHSNDFKETPSEERWKECVPRDQRLLTLRRLHNDPTAGHLGTLARAARLYYWLGMFSDVTRYVRFCRNCPHKSNQMRPAGLLHASAMKASWEQVTVDLVGPLPRFNGHT